jgi:mannose-6-phosphate isomerase-like protein (cupin superfamily)
MRTAIAAMLLLATAADAPAQPGGSDTAPAVQGYDNATDDAGTILARYAAAWRGRQEVKLDSAVTLGFRISGAGGGEYHIVLPQDGPGRLGAGVPPTVISFETDIDFLRRLDRNEMSALTAMAQARSSDPTPLVAHFPAGWQWTPQARAFFMPLAFHFWTREWPAVIRFGESASREVHGANGSLLFYDQGLRTAWYQVKEGMHVNADPRDQSNPFTSLLIITRGSMWSRLGGQEMTLGEGEAVLIPAGMTHEFRAGAGGYGEAILIMFGAGA